MWVKKRDPKWVALVETMPQTWFNFDPYPNSLIVFNFPLKAREDGTCVCFQK